MKKSALLAVSALSLGVVGLATFTPVVSAVEDTATVKVQIAGALGVNANEATVDLDTIIPGDTTNGVKTKTTTISTTNNTGTDATLTVKATNTNMTSGGNNIPTIGAEGKLNPGTSAWGVNTSGATGATTTFKPMTTGGVTIGTDDDREDNQKDFTITYGASASVTQPSGSYQVGVTYTFTN